MTAINYSKTAEKAYVDNKFSSFDKVLVINEHTYKVTKIGNQLWMSENLDEDVGVLETNEWYYDNDAETYGRNGKNYGRLYSWNNLNENLSNKLTSWGCSAWRLPSKEDYNNLTNVIGGIEIAGDRLKSSSDWDDNGNGTDYYSFKARPCGLRNGDFFYKGTYSALVTSSEDDSNNFIIKFLIASNTKLEEDSIAKINGASVRLVLDLNDDGSLPEDSSVRDIYVKKGEALEEIKHDDTISGDGTEENPLSVNEMAGASDEETFVKIGDRTYPVVKIGNQLWITENLDFTFSGLSVGQSDPSMTESRANYYNNDETTYGVDGNKYGLLYNWIAVKYLEDNKETLLPEGWHVPSTAEWDALTTVVGGASTAGTKLKSTTEWSSGNGTDDYGFSAFPAGRDGGSFSNVGSSTYFWTSSEYSDTSAYGRYFSTSASMDSYYNGKYNQYSVRLVKDVTSGGGFDGKKGLVPQPKASDAKKVLSGKGTFVNQPIIEYTDRKISQVQADGSKKEIVEVYSRAEVDGLVGDVEALLAAL